MTGLEKSVFHGITEVQSGLHKLTRLADGQQGPELMTVSLDPQSWIFWGGSDPSLLASVPSKHLAVTVALPWLRLSRN